MLRPSLSIARRVKYPRPVYEIMAVFRRKLQTTIFPILNQHQLLSVGYGQELAQLDTMDESDHLERLKRVETLFAIAVGEHDSKEAQYPTTPGRANSYRDNEAGENAGAVVTGSSLPTGTTTTAAAAVGASTVPPNEQEEAAADSNVEQQQQQQQQRQQQRQQQQKQGGVLPTENEDDGSLDDGRIERICVHAQSDLEQIACHASTAGAAAERFGRRRQSLAYLLYRGLVALFSDARAGARRMFVSECAADIGRIKQLAFSSSSFSRGGGEGGGGGGGGGGGQAERKREGDGIKTTSPPRTGRADGFCSGIVGGLALDAEGEKGYPKTGVTTTEAAAETAGMAEVGPEAARGRESRRVTLELQNEAKRVAFWDKVQREVLRRSTSEVTELLTADSLRQIQVEAGRARVRGGAESIQVTPYSHVMCV